MNVLPVCVYVHLVYAYCPWCSKDAVRVPGTGLTDDYELLCVLRIKENEEISANKLKNGQ